MGEEGAYGALGSRSWDHRGWRRNSFRGLGELEGKVQLCSTSRERLKPKSCFAALFPKVCNVGELMLGKSMGRGGPGSLGGHGS